MQRAAVVALIVCVTAVAAAVPAQPVALNALPPLTPTCSQVFVMNLTTTAKDQIIYMRTLTMLPWLVMTCFAHDYTLLPRNDGTYSPQCLLQQENLARLTLEYNGQVRLVLDDIFEGSLNTLLFGGDDAPWYMLYMYYRFYATLSDAACPAHLRVGISASFAAPPNAGFDVNLADLSPSILVKNESFTFRLYARSDLTKAPRVTTIRDYRRCAELTSTDPALQGVPDAVLEADKRHFTWTTTLLNSGYYDLCIEFDSGWQHLALYRVFGGNPMYFRLDAPGGRVQLGSTIDVDFYGYDLSPNDCVQLVSTILPCETPDHTQRNCSLGTRPSSFPGINITSWQMLVDKAGSYKLCYRLHGSTHWESVPHFEELHQNAKNWVQPNGQVNATPVSTRTQTISMSQHVVTAAPAIVPHPYTCTANDSSTNYTDVTFDCSSTHPICCWHNGVGACCPNGTTCSAGECYNATAPPNTGTPPPATLPPGAVRCNTTTGSDAREFVCLSDAPVCCPINATDGVCCPNGTECVGNGTCASATANATTAAPATTGAVECFDAGNYTCGAQDPVCCGFNGTAGCCANGTFCIDGGCYNETDAPTHSAAPPGPDVCGVHYNCTDDVPCCVVNGTGGCCPNGTMCVTDVGCVNATDAPVTTITAAPITTAAPPPTCFDAGNYSCASNDTCCGFGGTPGCCPVGTVCSNGECYNVTDAPTATSVTVPATTTAAPGTACNSTQTNWTCGGNATVCCPSVSGEPGCCSDGLYCINSECTNATAGPTETLDPSTTTTAAPTPAPVLCPYPAGDRDPFFPCDAAYPVCCPTAEGGPGCCANGTVCVDGGCALLTNAPTAVTLPTLPPTAAPTLGPYACSIAGGDVVSCTADFPVCCGSFCCPNATRCLNNATCVSVTDAPTIPVETTTPSPYQCSSEGVPFECTALLPVCCGYRGAPGCCDPGFVCRRGECVMPTDGSTAAPTAPQPNASTPAGTQCFAASGIGLGQVCPFATPICCGTGCCAVGQSCANGQCVVTVEPTSAAPTQTRPTDCTMVMCPANAPMCCAGPRGVSCCQAGPGYTCAEGLCLDLTNVSTVPATIVPVAPQTPAPVTNRSDRVVDCAAFSCPVSSPVCCEASAGAEPYCCPSGATCDGEGQCIYTTVPPTPPPTRTSAPTTTAAPTTTPPPTPSPAPTPTPTPCPTAPADFATPGLTASSNISFIYGRATLDVGFRTSLADLICVPAYALVVYPVVRQSGRRQSGNLIITFTVQCLNDCDDLERLRYAYYFLADLMHTPQNTNALGASVSDPSVNSNAPISIQAAPADESDGDKSTRWLLIIGVLIILLLLIIVIVLVWRRCKKSREGRYTHSTFVVEGTVAREAGEAYGDTRVREAEMDDMSPGNDSVTSDTPLGLDDVDVQVQIVPDKAPTY